MTFAADPLPPQPPTVADRLAEVRLGVADAAARAVRSADDITTIVVTKFHPASLVRELHALGVRDFGESRHQEASVKAADLADLDPTWHFVGQLQSKKARAVREYARVLHSVDRESLVDALASEKDLVDVFIQLNLTDDPARGGVAPDALESFADRVLGTSGVRLRGLMAVAPLGAEPRAAFADVRRASERLRTLAPDAVALSMGMSADYADAILEGATHLRIGTAITGNRPNPG
ncbi:YggS family pyridoxal phosphate-dependent enzyme [Glaciihabitans sp. dw_435]|uniref:YggS family pyridoxal phosphate-dependent enzyme n=1 Tax=Glaciihabitans sp. dw_435 TaxID=2720081 RepID=UPI0027DCE9B2|nr:YggS family pyridoxal phosphate-dependent enzyme [Glaciihabitans sp. dw_435]